MNASRLVGILMATALVVSACSGGGGGGGSTAPSGGQAPAGGQTPAAGKPQGAATAAPAAGQAPGGATAAPAAGQAQGGATIKFASVHPLTGALASSGVQMDHAITLAVDSINADGGIKALNGAKLEMQSADTQGKADVAQSETQRLIDGGAVAIIGTYQSAASVTVAQLAERSQVPFIMDVSVADNILQNGYKYSFRIQPNATTMGTFGARYLKEVSQKGNQPAKTVGYLHEPSDFGTSVFKAFQAEAQKQGLEITKEVTYDLSQTDLTAQATQALSGNPDVLAVTGYFADGVTLAKNLGLMKPNIKAVWGVADGAFDAPDFPSAVGEQANDYFDANYHYDATSKHLQDVRAKYKQQFNEDMRTESVFAYQAVYVLADSLERARSNDPKMLREAVAKTSLQTDLIPMLGPIQFDDKGEDPNAAPIINQVQGGQVLQVYPDNAAEKPPVFPGVPWSGS